MCSFTRRIRRSTAAGRAELARVPGDIITRTTQLAEIANKTQPRRLFVYHRGVVLPGRQISDEQYLTEIQPTYHGKVVIGQDLDVY